MTSRLAGEPGPERLDALVAAARAVRERAYAPYSNFPVGAAVLAGGDVFAGCNVENAAYSPTLCAERVAVGSAVAAGHRTIEAVAVVGPHAPITPCGLCRQVLHEFGPDMIVVSEGDGGERRVRSLAELLPHAFGPKDLA